MPNNREHNKICEQHGFNYNSCKIINKWMDKPSLKHPGCKHREFRHDKKSCDSIPNLILNNIITKSEAKKICLLHLNVDKENDLSCAFKQNY